MKVLSLFDGMSCGQIALKQLGIIRKRLKVCVLKIKQRNATCATNAMYMFLIRVINDVKQNRNEKKD